MTPAKTHTLIRWAVLDIGVAIAFVSTIVPLWGESRDVLVTELTTGVGIGFLVSMMPYIVFWAVTKKAELQIVMFAAATMVLLGIGGELFIASRDDAQAGIGYIYVILAQLGVCAWASGYKLPVDKSK